MPSRIIATGVEALESAIRLAEVAQPIQQGKLIIPVGTLDQDQKIFIVGIIGYEVVYFREDTLSAYATKDFLRGYVFGDFMSDIYRRTAWIIPATRIMVSFWMGATIGYVGAAAIVANVILTLIRIGTLISTHPREVEQVKVNLPKVARSVQWLRTECPVLSSKLGSLVKSGVWEAIISAPSNISAEDVASILGRCLGGVAALDEAVETGLKVVAKVVVKTLALYSALHAPEWAAHAAVSGADQMAKALADELRAQKVALTPEEEAAIAKELAKSAQALSQLQELQTALDAFAPALDTLVSEFAAKGI